MIPCFALFLAAVVACLATSHSLVWALLLGLALFFALGLRRGFSAKAPASMSWAKGKESLIVVPLFLLIGTVTAFWRASGTISFFLYYAPGLFLLMAFLLSAILSFALGTSFGVTGTAGVVLITLARSGGVNCPSRRGPSSPALTLETAALPCPPAPHWWPPVRGRSCMPTSGKC